MRRWLFNIAAAVSGVVMVIAVVLWARSYWYMDGIRWDQGFHFSVMSSHGTCIYGNDDSLFSPSETWWFSGPRVKKYDISDFQRSATRFCHFIGFGYAMTPPMRPHSVMTLVSVPHWFLVIAAGVFPTLFLYRWWHRIPLGHCHVCEYNLKGTIEAERGECPECGKAIGAQA